MASSLRQLKHTVATVLLVSSLGTGDRGVPSSNIVPITPAQALAASEQTTPYVTTGDVNLRSGPGTQYGIITTIKRDTKINVVSHEGDWLKIVSKLGNPPGYILDKFARPLEGEAHPAGISPGETYVTLADVNVRSGPGTQYSVVARIPRETKVQVIGVEGEWLKIESKHGNPPGYILTRDVRRF